MNFMSNNIFQYRLKTLIVVLLLLNILMQKALSCMSSAECSSGQFCSYMGGCQDVADDCNSDCSKCSAGKNACLASTKPCDASSYDENLNDGTGCVDKITTGSNGNSNTGSCMSSADCSSGQFCSYILV